MPNNTYSARLKAAQDKGAIIVASPAPFEGHPVEYRPRKRGDQTPWILLGKPEDQYNRFNGRFCHETWPNGKPTQPLGENQKSCLEAMSRYGGRFEVGGGWIWQNRSKTLVIMRALAKRGLVEQVSEKEYREAFRLTDAGWAEIGITRPKFDNAR